MYVMKIIIHLDHILCYYEGPTYSITGYGSNTVTK